MSGLKSMRVILIIRAFCVCVYVCVCVCVYIFFSFFALLCLLAFSMLNSFLASLSATVK